MEMAQLPPDLVAEILSWLPVKSLLRFKCLSKSSHALIDSNGFIHTHSTRSSQSLNVRKMIFLDSWNKKFHVCDVDLNSKNQVLSLRPTFSPSLMQVNGYCKGLILLNRSSPCHKPRLALWNPSTLRSKSLPECPPCLVPAGALIVGSGLGYDETGDEFKAFFIVKSQFWVYGLKSHIWRVLDFPYLITSYSTGFGQFADGSVHWWCRLSTNNQPEIVAFDVSKETFSLVPQPQPIEITTGFWGLHVLGESLGISYASDSRAELYVRNKNGSWSQIYSVREWLFDNSWFRSIMKVLGYIEGGKKILLMFVVIDDLLLVSYDLKAKSFERVRIEKNANYWILPILCCESLVSVDM